MKNILLVHDSQEDPARRKSYLESVGFKVMFCSKGEDCLGLVKTCHPDIVVMDILLKGKNGFELCREIRNHYSSTELPIILCSGIYRKRIFRDEAEHAGAQAYFIRPINEGDLVKQIYGLIDEPAEKVSASK